MITPSCAPTTNVRYQVNLQIIVIVIDHHVNVPAAVRLLFFELLKVKALVWPWLYAKIFHLMKRVGTMFTWQSHIAFYFQTGMRFYDQIPGLFPITSHYTFTFHFTCPELVGLLSHFLSTEFNPVYKGGLRDTCN